MLRRMMNLKLAAVMSAWRENVREKLRLQRILDTMVTRFTLAKMAAAFDGWVAAHQQQQRHLTLVTGCMRRLMNAHLSSAFAAWQEHVQQMVHAMRLLWRIANGHVHRSFKAWVGLVKLEKRHGTILNRITKRLGNGLLMMAMDGFKFNVEASKRAKYV